MIRFRYGLAVVAAAATTLSAASAQDALNLERVDTARITVRMAALQHAVGEQVLDENGAVDGAFFMENRICSMRGCRVFIFDKRSGALILNDRVWSEAYAPTGRGRQVIRVKAFAASEIPPAEPPSDEPLETAPAITKVTRVEADKKAP